MPKGNAKRVRASTARLTELRRGSYASARATERLLTEARDRGLPSAISRTSQWRARKEEASRMTPFGPLVREYSVPLKEGDFDVAIQHPMAMLHVSHTDCEPFRKLMRDTLKAHPPSAAAPWRIAMYCDEVGHNPIGRDNRKCEAIYWSFLEFGGRVLHTELGWFEVMVIRTNVVEKLPGFMSRLFTLILNDLFFDDVHNFSDGIILPDGISLVAKFACLVADEKALKEILCARAQVASNSAQYATKYATTRLRTHVQLGALEALA